MKLPRAMFWASFTWVSFTMGGPSPPAFSQDPIAKGAWSYEDGKPESVVFEYGTVLTAEEIERLSTVESLAGITMGYAGVDSEYVTVEGDLLKLGRLKNLETLHLCKDGIHDDDLRFIALLPKLHALELNADNGYEGAPICTDRCAKHLSAAKSLRELVIHDGEFTDKFVDQLTRGVPGLEALMMNAPDLTDKSLQLLAQRCKNLRSLSIHSDHFTAEGLKQLEKLQHLEECLVSSPSLPIGRQELEGTGKKGR